LVFARFQHIQRGKRGVTKLVSGVVTFGSAPLPIQIYEGPTARRKVKDSATLVAAESGDSESPTQPFDAGREGDSFGNVSRGDWIPTSDLLNPIHRPTLLQLVKDTTELFTRTSGYVKASSDRPVSI
jgi:hypothetical protein